MQKEDAKHQSGARCRVVPPFEFFRIWVAQCHTGPMAMGDRGHCVFGCSSEAKRTNNFPVEEQGNESVTLTLKLTPEPGKTEARRSSADHGRPAFEEKRALHLVGPGALHLVGPGDRTSSAPATAPRRPRRPHLVGPGDRTSSAPATAPRRPRRPHLVGPGDPSVTRNGDTVRSEGRQMDMRLLTHRSQPPIPLAHNYT
ncbi:unnamed protein product [Arctogadus glacialis]